jgi:hypothetical protein
MDEMMAPYLLVNYISYTLLDLRHPIDDQRNRLSLHTLLCD